VKIERFILGKAYRIRARLTFFLLDLYNFSNITIKRLRISTIFVEPSSNTDSKQACFAGITAPVFQEEGDGLLPLATRCENSLFEDNVLTKGCFQNCFQPFLRKDIPKTLVG